MTKRSLWAASMMMLTAACVTRAPYQSAGNSCRHLTGYPDLYAKCAGLVAVGNQMREDSWQAGMGSLPPAPAPSAPIEVPDFGRPTVMQMPVYRPTIEPLQQPKPPRAQTWGETPYAPQIPPVMRDRPVTEVNPMIPPAAR